MKKFLLPFQNVKFNIWLFAALAVSSVMGTLIPQVNDNPEKVREFVARSPRLGTFFERINFFNIYYSWWFIGLLGLMAFDVIVCKLIFGKFPGLHSFRKSEGRSSVISSQPFKAEWQTSLSEAEALERVQRNLEKENFGVKVKGSEEGLMLLAVKHRFQRFGSWVSHVSILIILLANLTGALYGFREVLNIPEGTSAKMEKRPWIVACDKFIVDWYEGTSTPKTFASDLRLFDKGYLAQSTRILVNEPLQYKKVRFYQATYGPYLKEAKVGFFLRKNPGKSPAVTLRLDEDVPVPGTPYSLRILEFIPDFSLDEKDKVVNRSVHPQNPALQVLVSKDGKPLKAPWIFQNFPAVQMPPIQKGDEFVLVLARYVPSYYTGLQITYDPGADLFWGGCTILVLGLMTLFYFHHRKLWVLIQKKPGGMTRVKVGAFSSKGKSFEAAFQALVNDLRSRTSAV